MGESHLESVQVMLGGRGEGSEETRGATTVPLQCEGGRCLSWEVITWDSSWLHWHLPHSCSSLVGKLIEQGVTVLTLYSGERASFKRHFLSYNHALIYK